MDPPGCNSSNFNLHGLVDMGSNGIRFSITNLEARTARILPTIFQDRSAISLYDAQFREGAQKSPIPEATITDVLDALASFKTTCRDFQVPEENIRIVATEATRQAINGAEFRRRLEAGTGWPVEILPKEEEGRVGALGIVSSFPTVCGLAMDLGGGSVQLTWIGHDELTTGLEHVRSVSLPYGAAALKLRLSETSSAGSTARSEFREKLIRDLSDAIKTLRIPDGPEGVCLYLSGGGFRGWGYLLMASHAINPYPIPTINGFSVPATDFPSPAALEPVNSSTPSSVFRISSRRASQVPAVSFLISALLEVLPCLSAIHFAQGGLREGYQFSKLPKSTQREKPLEISSVPMRSNKNGSSLASLLTNSIPRRAGSGADPLPSAPPFLVDDRSLLSACANLVNFHADVPKDLRAAAALRFTTTGQMASAHGLSHLDRARLALVLCHRWGGSKELAPVDSGFFQALQQLVGNCEAWWCTYTGLIAKGLGQAYPAGAGSSERLKVVSEWRAVDSAAGSDAESWAIKLDVGLSDGQDHSWVKQVRKLGKRKNWISGYGWSISTNGL